MLKRPGPVEHSTLTIQHSSEAGPDGAVAQLGEHLLCKQGVVGSIPISSTRLMRGLRLSRNGICVRQVVHYPRRRMRPRESAVSTTVVIELSAGLRDRKFLDN